MVGLLDPPGGKFADPHIARPEALFPSGAQSLRPKQTVEPLAAALKLTIDTAFLKGQEDRLVDAVKSAGGVTLIAWQHEAIPTIAALILGGGDGVPPRWPGHRAVKGTYNNGCSWDSHAGVTAFSPNTPNGDAGTVYWTNGVAPGVTQVTTQADDLLFAFGGNASGNGFVSGGTQATFGGTTGTYGAGNGTGGGSYASSGGFAYKTSTGAGSISTVMAMQNGSSQGCAFGQSLASCAGNVIAEALTADLASAPPAGKTSNLLLTGAGR